MPGEQSENRPRSFRLCDAFFDILSSIRVRQGLASNSDAIRYAVVLTALVETRKAYVRDQAGLAVLQQKARDELRYGLRCTTDAAWGEMPGTKHRSSKT